MRRVERRIILCAGHGGKASGATLGAKVEAAEAIEIVNRTAAKLGSDGRLEAVVVPHELELKPSIEWINARFHGHEDGYCAEVHKNSGGGMGVEGWYRVGLRR